MVVIFKTFKNIIPQVDQLFFSKHRHREQRSSCNHKQVTAGQAASLIEFQTFFAYDLTTSELPKISLLPLCCDNVSGTFASEVSITFDQFRNQPRPKGFFVKAFLKQLPLLHSSSTNGKVWESFRPTHRRSRGHTASRPRDRSWNHNSWWCRCWFFDK